MVVKELIKILKKCNKNLPIKVAIYNKEKGFVDVWVTDVEKGNDVIDSIVLGGYREE